MHSFQDALSRVHSLVEKKTSHVLHTSEISRADREILLKHRWLEEIIRGWYLVIRPDLAQGDSTAWFASFWDFLREYLEHNYGTEYCLSAESSLDLHVGSLVVPSQVIVMALKGSGTPLQLPHGTSLLVYADPKRLPKEKVLLRGLQVMTLEYALCKVSPAYFRTSPQEVELALRSIHDPNTLLKVIADNNFKSAAGRIIGAYTFLKDASMSEKIKNGLGYVGIRVDEVNPFDRAAPFLKNEVFPSPYVARLHAMWEEYRKIVLKNFPPPPGLAADKNAYMKTISKIYVQDAYNSLSIEGYQVTEGLIEKVRKAEWNPDQNSEDKDRYNALAARGYYEAHLGVEESVRKILDGGNAGKIVLDDLHKWYQSMFFPMVSVGILTPSDLFGYRRGQVYIRGSRYTPPGHEHVKECMDALFALLEAEPHAAVRALLGHFFFVYIHPFMDGNGRIGRFLMNTMFASGGYPWTIIRVVDRDRYMSALECASVGGDILPFTQFIAHEAGLRDMNK